MDEQTLFKGVCDCIRQALERDLPDIQPTDRLVADLGVDSLDFLDLIFRINQQFGVDINPRDIGRRTQALIGEALLVEGCYTARAVEELKRAMPEVPADEFYPGMPERQLLTSFRIKTFMNLVALELENGGHTT